MPYEGGGGNVDPVACQPLGPEEFQQLPCRLAEFYVCIFSILVALLNCTCFSVPQGI